MNSVSLDTNYIYFPLHFCIMPYLSYKNIFNLSSLSYKFLYTRYFSSLHLLLLLEFSSRNYPVSCSQPRGSGWDFSVLLRDASWYLGLRESLASATDAGISMCPTQNSETSTENSGMEVDTSPPDQNLRGRKFWSYWLPSWNCEIQAKWRIGLILRKWRNGDERTVDPALSLESSCT